MFSQLFTTGSLIDSKQRIPVSRPFHASQVSKNSNYDGYNSSSERIPFNLSNLGPWYLGLDVASAECVDYLVLVISLVLVDRLVLRDAQADQPFLTIIVTPRVANYPVTRAFILRIGIFFFGWLEAENGHEFFICNVLFGLGRAQATIGGDENTSLIVLEEIF